MSTERTPQVILSLRQRLEIVQKLENGVAINQLAYDYGVSSITVRRIKRNAAELRQRLAIPGAKCRKKMRKPVLEDLDARLFKWYEEQQASGVCISDSILQSTSKKINGELGGPSTFSASKGWIWRFKNRHGIRLGKSSSEIVQIEPKAAEEFLNEYFLRRLKEEDVKLHNVYSVQETVLMWKALPPAMITDAKGKAYREKLSVDRVTVGLCVNATGTHKLPPLFIQKYEKPRALKHCADRLPVICKTQKRASLDQAVFADWLQHHFKPAVKKQQLLTGIYGKILLLITDCENHGLPTELQKRDGIEVVFLPANIAPLLQPIDQVMLHKVKRSFRHRLLRRVLDFPAGMPEFCADYDLRDCMDALGEAWMDLRRIDICNSWSKLFKEVSGEETGEEQREVQSYDMSDVSAIRETLGNIVGKPVPRDNVEEWLFTCEDVEDKIGNVKEEYLDHSTPSVLYEEKIEKMFTNLVIWSKTVPDFINPYGPKLKCYYDLRQK